MVRSDFLRSDECCWGDSCGVLCFWWYDELVEILFELDVVGRLVFGIGVFILWCDCWFWGFCWLCGCIGRYVVIEVLVCFWGFFVCCVCVCFFGNYIVGDIVGI